MDGNISQQEAVDMLRQLEDFDQFGEMADVISRLQDKLSITRQQRKPIVHFDSVPDLKGLKFLTPKCRLLHSQTAQPSRCALRASQVKVNLVHYFALSIASAAQRRRVRAFSLASVAHRCC